MTVAIFGTFDVPNYGDLLFPLLAQRRLAALGQDLLVVSPAGGQPFADALPAMALDDALAAGLSLRAVLLGGGNIVHAAAAQDVYTQLDPPRIAAYPSLWLGAEAAAARSGAPLVWNAPGLPAPLRPEAAALLRRVAEHSAYVAVRDAGSLAHLEATGVGRRARVVPDPAHEVGRLFPRAELDETFRLLTAMKGRSSQARYVALQASPHRCTETPEQLAAHFDAIAAALDATPLLLSIGPCHGDGALLRRAAGCMQSRPLVFDTPVRLTEIAACLAHAVAYVGASLHGAITALAHGVPFLVVARGADHKLAGLLEPLGCPERHVLDWSEAEGWVGRHARHLALRPDLLDRRDGLLARVDEHWEQLLAVVRSAPRRRRPTPAQGELLPPALLRELLGAALAPRAAGAAGHLAGHAGRSPSTAGMAAATAGAAESAAWAGDGHDPAGASRVPSAPPVPRPVPRPADEPVTVIVTVHEAYEAVARCLDALLTRTPEPHRVLLVDDGSRDPRVVQLLQHTAAAQAHVELLVHAEALGYTASIQEAWQRVEGDVVLLNSDTEVTRGWLGRLSALARSEAAVATVTPLSNAAGAFSIPLCNQVNVLPEGLDAEGMAELLAEVSPRIGPRAPTGNGFCMYVTRAALVATGGFDAQRFPQGYGEENDFCVRAAALGYVHLVEDATYVWHARGASFGARREELLEQHQQRLRELHPLYERDVARWLQADALGPVRAAVSQRLGLLGAPLLVVLHEGQGGVQYTTDDLLRHLRRHHPCVVLSLGGDGWTVTDPFGACETRLRFRAPWRVSRPLDPERRAALAALCTRHGVRLVHVRHLQGAAPELIEALADLGLPVVFSIHDYYTICPTVKLRDEHGRHCGGHCSAGAGDCPGESPAASSFPFLKHAGVYEWRRRTAAALQRCAALVETSAGVRRLMLEHFPALERSDWVHIEHGRDLLHWPDCAAPPRPGRGGAAPPGVAATGRVRLVFLGVLNEAKGAGLLARLCELNLAQGRPFELHLLGPVGDFPWQRLGAHWHGAYVRDELPALLAAIRPSFCLLPSQWPETWSHTLSEAWAAGIPVLASDLGALRERIEEHGGGWLVEPYDARAWLQTLHWIVNSPGEHARKRDEIKAMLPPGTADMARAYLSLYARLIDATPVDATDVHGLQRARLTARATGPAREQAAEHA